MNNICTDTQTSMGNPMSSGHNYDIGRGSAWHRFRKGFPCVQSNFFDKVLVCGGGRKNKILLGSILKNISSKIKVGLIDEYEIDGDFVESQAFAYLAIRSFLKLPITFPNTTGCELPSTGGILAKNF